MASQSLDSLASQRLELERLDAKINALLPPRYQHCYGFVQPTSMGSAGLKFGADGKVAWDQIWTSFCDLALAGGPPHRGTLLEPAAAAEVFAEPQKYQAVVEEIGRGIWLVTELPVLPRLAPGWVGVRCESETAAVWMTRAIVAENITARHAGEFLYLPAGPHYRLEKEVKNVVTSVAKTHHYWAYHKPSDLPPPDVALVVPATAAEAQAEPEKYRAVVAALKQGIERGTGLRTVLNPSPGWVGVKCGDDGMAVWLMRAVLVENILARREGSVVYVPAAPNGTTVATTCKVVAAMSGAWRLWLAHLAVHGRGACP